MVVHVDVDLSSSLDGVRDSESVPDLDLVVDLPPHAEESSKDAILVLPSSQVVVENGGKREGSQNDGRDGASCCEAGRRECKG